MAILGIDYGAKKIGLAKSDDKNKFAMPLEIIKSDNQKEILKRIKEVCEQEDIEKIIVGVPISLKAEKRDNLFRLKDLENKQMQEVLVFVDWLKDNLKLPLEVEDERLSSKMANRLGRGEIKRKGDDDAVAAMLILQSYLDKNS
ncbi:MAG: Holliday junction resolvase RuvX [Candidatus Buchananbacteria bacterium]